MYNTSFLKSAVMASNAASQTLAADGVVAFSTNNLLTGCAITKAAGSTDIILNRAGLYQVFFYADFSPTAAGTVTFQLLNSSVPVSGAEASVTGAADTTYNAGLSALVRVLPNCPAVDNTATLQVQASAAVTLNNAVITVVKLA